VKRPPVLMRLRFHNGDRKFGLWLPLFLLIPLALVVLIILSPLIIIAIAVLWPSGWGKLALLVLKAAWGLLCSMPGLEVNVRNPNQCVYISVI
jgi:hypothetical protein